MIIWFEAGQDTSFRVVLKTISCPQTPYCKNPPGILSPHENPHFWRVFCDFKSKFHNFSQHLLIKFFMSSKSVKLPLQNPIFGFFISPMVIEISWLLFKNTAIPDFQITTFIFSYIQLGIFLGGGWCAFFKATLMWLAEV